MLDYSFYSFQLVSNNCNPRERLTLRQIAENNSRSSYYSYPTNQSQIHGRVLTHLQARCQQEYFCFMDSDIFVTAPLPDFERIMREENLSALFGCMPLWVKQSEYICKPHFKSIMGTFNQMEADICLGSTYFAIYRNEHLTQIMQYYGVPFDECTRNQMPSETQRELANMGYHQQFFDTGKVINLLMNKHGMRMKNIEIPQLCHIGGTSYETTYQQQPLNWKTKVKNRIEKTILKKVIDHRHNYYFNKRFKDYTKEEFQINYNQRVLHRNITRQHFLKLYLALVNKQHLPLLPVFQDDEITENIQLAHQAYIDNFKKYHETRSI